MVSDRCFSLIFFFILIGLASSSFISYDVYESNGSTGRNLLQAKADCSVNFETMNYTILTSQCKGPQYLPKLCCDAFKQFACPYTEQINDLKTNCAETMFSYINLYGKYPPGLFANLCKEGKEGLACSGNETTSSKDSVSQSGAPIGYDHCRINSAATAGKPVEVGIDHFDSLPDSLLLLILNIGEVKALGRCCVVLRRSHSLVHHTKNVVVHIDCVISDDDAFPPPDTPINRTVHSHISFDLYSVEL
ncbi:hypothetical protein F0562_010812 [Nyssa sinensis]|uniref:GPI-anchored protein LLG1-like domain-containing protein n=1 Tax=Nyssa sinensis TaxID=561372 RepID=A0A5J5A519_9ASTE|nr:hypothetical protein F0562_010812 [Nyssa sinensis]